MANNEYIINIRALYIFYFLRFGYCNWRQPSGFSLIDDSYYEWEFVFMRLKSNVQGRDDSSNSKLATKYISNAYRWLTMNILQIFEPCIFFISFVSKIVIGGNLWAFL